MTRRSRFGTQFSIFAASAALSLAACSGTDEDVDPDAAQDATTDTGGDAAPDGADDTSVDTATDSAADTGADTAADTGSDTSADVATDTASDTATDTATDTSPDTGSDVAADTAADTGGDTAEDTATDTGSDVVEECPAALAVQDDGTGSSGAVGVPDLVISEIDPGTYIELFNTTDADIALSGSAIQLCSRPAYSALSARAPSVTVPAGGYATIPWPPTFMDVDAGGEIILYANSSFATNTAILDYVCWGSIPHMSRKDQAEAVGKWSGDCAPALSAGSIARLASTTGTSASDYTVTETRTGNDCTP